VVLSIQRRARAAVPARLGSLSSARTRQHRRDGDGTPYQTNGKYQANGNTRLTGATLPDFAQIGAGAYCPSCMSHQRFDRYATFWRVWHAPPTASANSRRSEIDAWRAGLLVFSSRIGFQEPIAICPLSDVPAWKEAA
jgi:hypothetical protein